MDNVECSVCYEPYKMECIFECNHSMCLTCMLEHAKNREVCHICRKKIDYTHIKIKGGLAHIFLRQLSGGSVTLSSVDLESITSAQLHQLAELKLYGVYTDHLRLIYAGKSLQRTKNSISIEYPKIGDCSSLHCVGLLRGD